VVIVFILAATPAFTQTVSAACQALPRGFRAPVDTALEQRARRWTPRILKWINNQNRERNALLQPFQIRDFAKLWTQDPPSVELALAELVASDDNSTRLEAEDAVDLYRHYSGRAAPLLSRVRPSIAYHRTMQILRAINEVQTSADIDNLARIACIAAWKEQAITRDTWIEENAVLWEQPWESIRDMALALLPAEVRPTITAKDCPFAPRTQAGTGQSEMD
jgi:hypothetical protein